MNDFSKYVKKEIIENIKKTYCIKTNKEAEKLLWEAIGYNLVEAEIFGQIDYMKEKEKEEKIDD